MSAAIYCPGLRCFEETDLEVQCKLGEGSYGSVHRVRTKCGLWMAVKKVGVDWFDYGLPPSTLREVSLLNKLKGLKCPNRVVLPNNKITKQVILILLSSLVLYQLRGMRESSFFVLNFAIQI